MRPSLLGVTETHTSAGRRWRVSVSLAGYGSQYMGSFDNVQLALEAADDVRWWAWKLGLVPREPRLNVPERFADPERLPGIPAKVQRLADEKALRDAAAPTEPPKFTSISQLVDRLTALESRVAALEKVPSKNRKITLTNQHV